MADHRAGRLVKNLTGDAGYLSFLPAPLPPAPPLVFDEEMTALLVAANRQIALLEGAVTQIPDVNQFISMYVRKEALMSSQIEGTQATLEDVLDPNIIANTNQDVAEVVNYIKATEYTLARLNELPLCSRLIKETHAVLMQGARGQEKSPGNFRYTQNWIGPAGSTLQNASYIPPSPEDMAEAFSALEKYLNNADGLDTLIRAALVHYQFETIHPFLDGNGRVGRLLILLVLIDGQVLSTPTLYISYFLKRNRVEYYDRMTEVRNKGTYEQWVKFFLRACESTASNALATIRKLSDLQKRNVELIVAQTGSTKTLLRLLEYLEKSPIIIIGKTAAELGLSYNTVATAISRLRELSILVQTGGEQRSRVFAYDEYLGLLRSGTE